MIITDICCDGNTYPCRVVESNEGERLIIGSQKLLDALQPGSFNDENEGFASKEAESIYDEILASPKSLSLGNSSELDCSRLPAIFFFTDDATLGLPDSELIEELKIDNPEWFD